MRNIVTGKYNDKSKIQTGYLKTKKKHQEGDIWEERGKTWTIKNGIKQNVTKLDSVRAANRMPQALLSEAHKLPLLLPKKGPSAHCTEEIGSLNKD